MNLTIKIISKTLMTKISHISWGGYDKGFYGTLELISSQKLGICKPGVPAVIGPDWPQTFMRDYMEKDLKLNLDDVNFLQYAPKTKGNYQLENTEIPYSTLSSPPPFV